MLCKQRIFFFFRYEINKRKSTKSTYIKRSNKFSFFHWFCLWSLSAIGQWTLLTIRNKLAHINRNGFYCCLFCKCGHVAQKSHREHTFPRYRIKHKVEWNGVHRTIINNNMERFLLSHFYYLSWAAWDT